MSRSRQAPRRTVEVLAHDYPSGHRIKPHHHDRHQLVYARSGVMTVQTPDGTWVVPPHRAVWIPRDVTHAIEISGPVAMRTLYLGGPAPRSTACRMSSRRSGETPSRRQPSGSARGAGPPR